MRSQKSFTSRHLSKEVNSEVAGAAKNVMKKLKEEVDKKASKCRSPKTGGKGRGR